MVIIFVLVTFALFITINLIISSRKKASKELAPLKIPPVSAKDYQERFFHPGHSWIFFNPLKVATVGVDDFTKHLLGKVENIELPVESTFIHQGDPLVTLRRGKKSLTIVSPLSGILKEVNHPLELHPELINNSPYNDGWITKIVPINLTRELRNLLQGKIENVWREALRVQLINFFSPRLGSVLQDGGQLVENISDLITDDEWKKIVEDFFPADFRFSTNNNSK